MVELGSSHKLSAFRMHAFKASKSASTATRHDFHDIQKMDTWERYIGRIARAHERYLRKCLKESGWYASTTKKLNAGRSLS